MKSVFELIEVYNTKLWENGMEDDSAWRISQADWACDLPVMRRQARSGRPYHRAKAAANSWSAVRRYSFWNLTVL